ncbi:hypothetical protein THIARS_50275 [Thiomonas delicata]|uniref:Uncharacterized protein n=1 Tax=Thiomonas delicata TaxID=364030 RepID=A0A238D181_THIDL|nr:hypothetical protein THIARS_50275 [Thiomonas delicata]
MRACSTPRPSSRSRSTRCWRERRPPTRPRRRSRCWTSRPRSSGARRDLMRSARRANAWSNASARPTRGGDDDRRPRGPDGKPRGGRYARDFGVPKDGYPDLAVGVSIRQDT